MKKLLFLSILSLLFILPSCSSDEDNDKEDSFENAIIGEWEYATKNGEFYEFKSDATYNFIDKSDDPYSIQGVWRIDSNILHLINEGESEAIKYKIKRLDKNFLVVSEIYNEIEYKEETYIRVK